MTTSHPFASLGEHCLLSNNRANSRIDHLITGLAVGAIAFCFTVVIVEVNGVRDDVRRVEEILKEQEKKRLREGERK
ncbi:hypothetical protein HK097_006463, partial [Rhizophlyctis rosea]